MEILHKLEQIEAKLYDRAFEMNAPTLEEDLGVIILEAVFYNYSNEDKYKKKAITLLENAINVFPTKKLETGFFEGFEGIFWVVDYLIKNRLIEDESILDDLKPYLFISLQNDIDVNNFDTLHGSINKLQYLINSASFSQKVKDEYINKFVDSLFNTRVENENGIYWYDSFENEKGLVNLGLAHGLGSLLVFLTMLKNEHYQNPNINVLINGIFKSLMSFKNETSSDSFFPDYYSELDQTKSVNSRLAWCYGDLGIAYALLYSSESMQNNSMKSEALSVIHKICRRVITNSKIDHFEEYSFLDTGFCHGISGIVYILSIMNDNLQEPLLNQRINYWKNELLINLDKQLNISDDIYYPWYRQDSSRSYMLDECSMLTGLTGTGLVLLSIYFKEYDWSNFFLLYKL